MLNNGEYYFKTFEEALLFVSAPTNYEKEKGIKVAGNDILINLPDIKLVQVKKSDYTKTLIIFFKNSTKYDIWKFWIPSKDQQMILPDIAQVLQGIDKINDEARK